MRSSGRGLVQRWEGLPHLQARQCGKPGDAVPFCGPLVAEATLGCGPKTLFVTLVGARFVQFFSTCGFSMRYCLRATRQQVYWSRRPGVQLGGDVGPDQRLLGRHMQGARAGPI